MRFAVDPSVTKEMLKMGGIYCLTNRINGKQYIGQVCWNITFGQRFSRHSSELKHGKHVNKHLQRSYYKHGYDAFVFTVVLVVEDAYLTPFETAVLDKVPPELRYNLDGPVCSPNLGRKFDEEHCRRISENKKGLRWPEESKRALSAWKMGQPQPHRRKSVVLVAPDGTEKRFGSVGEAAAHLGLTISSISQAKKTGGKASGHVVRYENALGNEGKSDQK